MVEQIFNHNLFTIKNLIFHVDVPDDLDNVHAFHIIHDALMMLIVMALIIELMPKVSGSLSIYS